MPEQHWALAWIGTPYVPGAYDCFDFVRDVMSAQFGREIRIPPRPQPASRRTNGRLIAAARDDSARRVDNPREGDAVLLREAGCSLPGFHVGIYVTPEMQPSVLHCAEGTGAMLQPLDGLAGWAVDGYWRWK